VSDASQKLRVFISYARSDSGDFAEGLLAGLEAAGFDPFLDRHDIAPGEDWQARLDNLLQQADTIVYVLSPAFVASERCGWELDRAEALSKRIIPIVAIDVAEAETPPKLRRLNYIFFSRGNSFGAALRQLSIALRTDLAWVREHTRLGDLAIRWRGQGKSESLLLRGSELDSAKAWLAEWKAGSPDITGDHRDYINDSNTAEQLRTNQELKKLEEIRGAQADREKALKRVARANRIWGGVTIALLIATVASTYLAATTSSNAMAQNAAAQESKARADQSNMALQAKLNDTQKIIDALLLAKPSAPPPATASEAAVAGGLGQAGAPAATEPDLRQAPEVSDAIQQLKEVSQQARIATGIDIDVFFCRVEGAKARATSVHEVLATEQARQLAAGASATTGLPFQIGRLRLRDFPDDRNSLSGYKIRSDEVRAEKNEAEAGTALRTFVEARGGLALNAGKMPDNPTPYYLSVFLCEGATP